MLVVSCTKLEMERRDGAIGMTGLTLVQLNSLRWQGVRVSHGI